LEILFLQVPLSIFPAFWLVSVVGSFSQSRILEQKALEIPVQTSIV